MTVQLTSTGLKRGTAFVIKLTDGTADFDWLAEELEELRKKEEEAGYTPDWELDAFMKAEIRKGKKESIVTDLVIKLLGLDVSLLFFFHSQCPH